MSWRASLSKNSGLWLIIGIGTLMVLPAGAVLASGSVAGSTAGTGGLPHAVTGGPHPSVAPPTTVPLQTTRGAATISPSAFESLPSSYQSVPWIASLAHHGSALPTLASVPNLALLEHPIPSTAQINPFYVAQPAPLGLGDFGLGATNYSYNVSHLMGEVRFNSPPNVTDPQSVNVIEPQGQADGNVGSVYEMGIQLNTVATNISLPGSDQGFFWTQNVVNFNDTGIHFVDDTFNMTSATQSPFYIQPGTIYSACGLKGAAIQKVVITYGGVFQCVGGTVPISAASYPITVQLYNNASINAQQRTVVSYGYRFTLAGTHKVYTGISDQIVFNSPTPFVPPANKPGFSIDGFAPSPTGLFRDAEIVLVGDIGGDNSVFRNVSGSVNLEYSNASVGGWKTTPSAYNFGGDTGETSSGIADYWTPSHTLEINQGPSMLYGLWGAVANVSVHSGSIQVKGSISPNYGFVFVSNTPGVLDPWGTTGVRDNMSWLPTTNSGSFDTWLPPLGAPWTTAYSVEAFADGFAELNGTPITGTVTSYAIHLHAAAGTLNAPLYMFSNAQASLLAKVLTGTPAAPYTFSNLRLAMNFSFNHVNDYSFPDFVMFMSQGVTNPVWVSNVYEGNDSTNGNFYIGDFTQPPEQGMLAPAPFLTGDDQNFTAGINLYGGSNDRVSNMALEGEIANIQIVLWDDENASVTNVSSALLSPGVFVGESFFTTVTGVTVTEAGTGVTDMVSHHTSVSLETVSGTFGPSSSLGIEGLGSTDLHASSISVSDGGIGLSTGVNYGASADYDPYYYLPGTMGLTVSALSAQNGSLGANITLSGTTTVVGLSVANGSNGVIFDDSPNANVRSVDATNLSTGVMVIDSSKAFVTTVDASVNSTGVEVVTSHGVSVTQVVASDHSNGAMVVRGSFGVKVSFVLATDHSIGVWVDGSSAVVVTHVVARHHSIQVYVV